mmetsp:Transcript_19181/g.40345  ORF Transcript_19181/g.40345 Transcript_19181/m.40345 type:complete len:80 (+) Transcript_19181:432-671(+)
MRMHPLHGGNSLSTTKVSPLRIGSINAQVFGDFVQLRGQGLLTLGQVLLTLGQGLLTLSQFAQALEDDLQRKIESIVER